MSEIFVQLSLVIAVVLAVSLIMKALKQPLIIGYIASGILIGPLVFNIAHQSETLEVFSEFGIAFLLFIVGLNLSPKVIKEVGKISIITGVGQVVFTTIVGYVILIALGFSAITSLYIAAAITFSSTIIIMKLLSDKGELRTLYGKISTGFLLVQDLIAILIMIVVSSLSSETNVFSSMVFTFLKGIVLVGVLIPLGIFILPKFEKFFARSQELLFIFSIAWGLGLAALFFVVGLSMEVGALIAGVILSISPYSVEVSSKLRPLRDFFIISFFLLLGIQMAINGFGGMVFPAVIISLFILIGNPLIVMVLMGVFGYTKRTGFKAGLTVAQISEFSLILIALGVKVGHLTSEVLSLVTFVGLITIAGSTYLIIYSDKIYPYLSRYISVFEKKNARPEKELVEKKDVILFGYNRIGFGILNTLKKIKKKYVVVDLNPDTISNLKKLGVPAVYGDAYNSEFLDELDISKAGLVISTIPEVDVSAFLIKYVKKSNPKAIIIVRANQTNDALELYKKGADYVLTPHFVGGEYVAKMISEFKNNDGQYKEEKERHLKLLHDRIKFGQKYRER